MQMLLPRYLEVSIDSFTKEQEKYREQMSKSFGVGGFNLLEDQVRRNMEMFERAFSMFLPFAQKEGAPGETPGGGEQDIDELKRQVAEMNKRLERLTGNEK
jgi:polyhydroxyalkanoate synthesis regulator protein